MSRFLVERRSADLLGIRSTYGNVGGMIIACFKLKYGVLMWCILWIFYMKIIVDLIIGKL